MEKIIRNDAGEIVAQIDGDNETFYTEEELIESGQLEPEVEPTEEEVARRRRDQVVGAKARRATYGERMGAWERSQEERRGSRWEERLGSED